MRYTAFVRPIVFIYPHTRCIKPTIDVHNIIILTAERTAGATALAKEYIFEWIVGGCVLAEDQN